ncbi:MAG: hypothetical protein OXI81_02895 [Paracoccaceae bacterium]|nr:hypothetical protein [Paracoccaceae bacterium]
MRSRKHLDVLAKAGTKVAVTTGKDKLRRLLGYGFDVSEGHVCFSPQHADRCAMEENGIEGRPAFLCQPQFDMYSEELSPLAFDNDIDFFDQNDRPWLPYPLLSKHVQHKYAPVHPRAHKFCKVINNRFARFAELSASSRWLSITT